MFESVFAIFFAFGSIYAILQGAAIIGFLLSIIAVLFALLRDPTLTTPAEVEKRPEYYICC